MKRLAVIGGGISGLTVANILLNSYDVTVFEREKHPGGLIKCKMIEGSLFHTCGGHVFNTKREDVLNLFWSFFDKEGEFIKADRNSVVLFSDSLEIPYPIENHLYLFNDEIVNSVISDLLNNENLDFEVDNFEDFLKNKFGKTLYELYFKPYNSKIWKTSLSNVPLKWLEGKLPMPTLQEIIFNNIRKIKEKKFVHSSFWYEKKNGSQFIADRLAQNLNIKYNVHIESVSKQNGHWIVNGEKFDKVVFCGNIQQLPSMLNSYFPSEYVELINKLKSHGTTSVFCEIDQNPYSWVYLPNESYSAHRIICTGNFSKGNNSPGKMTGTVEFTDEISKDEILKQLKQIPLSPHYITHEYNPCTYPIQDNSTRSVIQSIKEKLAKKDFYLTGRFADWEYYNMDAAMGAAIDMVKRYQLFPDEFIV